MQKLLFLFLCFIWFSCDKSKEGTLYHIKTQDGKVEWNFTRTFPFEVELVDQHDFKEGQLLEPRTFGEHWYAIERSSWYVHQFGEQSFNTQNKFGVPGSGAIEETNHFFHYAFEDSQYYLFDNQISTLKQYTLDNQLAAYIRFDFFGNAMTKGEGNHFYFITDTDEDDDLIFAKIAFPDHEPIATDSLSRILNQNKSEDLEMLYDAYILHGDGYIVVAFKKYGSFLLFDSDLNLKDEIKTIDGTPAPRMEEISDGQGDVIYTTNPPFEIISHAIIFEQKLYLLSMLSKQDHRCIDIYDLKEGAYEGSIRIDALEDTQLPLSFTFLSNGELVVIFEDMSLRKYRVKPLSS
ncbi:MAG: hypothetical protein LAT68_07790 [Cyclobacteriaceae bacterium]|nr:hypothetical protein [Cyclobacteriaceae bacterium]MCH8516214.1 hypothetical protein [Cyclobacteriaceae bacterium]